MQKFLVWLVQSSADPDKVALTIKGILLGFIPLAIVAARVFGWEFAQQDYEDAALYISGGLAALLTLIGFLRKLWNTFKQ